MTPIVRGGIWVAAVVATTWDDLVSGRLGPIGITLLGVLGIGTVAGYASWLRTTYLIEDDELRIDTGLVTRRSRRIRVDRLQGVDVKQPFLARLFGLAELAFDTAGGDREGTLAFLPLDEAHRLRELLLARRDAVRRSRGDAGPEVPVAERGWAPPDHDIAVLDLRTLMISNLLSVGTIMTVLLFALAGVALLWGGIVVVTPAAPVVVGFALVQLRRLAGYWGFAVSQTRQGLQIRRGLFDRTTQTITLARVQGVVVTEPLLWRRLGWAQLDVAVAGYGTGQDSDGGPSATTVMPVAPRALVLDLARHLLRGRPTASVYATDAEDPDPDDAGAPDAPDDAGDAGDPGAMADAEEADDAGTVLAEAAGPQVDPDAVALTPPPARARWVDPVGRRFIAGGMGPDLLVSRSGWLHRRTHVVRHARVQSLRLRQGPLQRLARLADVVVDSPPGPVSVRLRHRSADEARALLDEAVARGRKARLSGLES